MATNMTAGELGRAIETGMRMLNDESVRVPASYIDGLADLKKLFRLLMSGEYGINTDPAAAAEPAGGGPSKLPPLPDRKSNNGNGKGNDGDGDEDTKED